MGGITPNFVAQEIYVDISCTNQYPGVGEKIKLSYILKKKLKNGFASYSSSGIKISKPKMGSLNIVDEGTEGSSFSFGNMGGDMQISKYSFILQPTKEGDVTIGPFSFQMNGETFSSESYVIHVGKGNPNTPIIKQNANYFIRIDVSKKELYQGDHALVSYTLYSRSSNISIQDYDFPMANGFWAEDISGGNQGFQQSQETINGMAYLKVPLKKELIYAQKTGKVEIPAFNLQLYVGGGFFSQGSTENLTSNSVTLDVKPLPSGAPSDFDNQVGKSYELDVSYSTLDLKAGEPIDVKVKISGKGNLRQLNPPTLIFPSDFEAYDPDVNDKTSMSASGISGYKEFTYLVIPRHHGIYEIPALTYSYYDLGSGSYKTLSSEPRTINVAKSENSTPATTNGNATHQEEVEVLNNEIRHIVYDTELSPEDSSFYGSGKFWISITSPFALTIGLFIFFGLKKEEREDVTSLKKKASKEAVKALKAAETKLAEKDDNGFYEELYKGLMTFISKKLDTPLSQLSKEGLSGKIEDPELYASLVDTLEECEMARFAPVTHAGALETMNKAKELIQKIERHVK